MSSEQSEPKFVPPTLADDSAGEESKPVEGPSFPIVGIGASAGGLEAFTELLKHLPLDTGMGFVLVQHLDPQHESALTQLLARVTSMPVREVTNNLRVEANHVYVIPPNTDLGIAQGVLKLQPRPQTRTPHRSIDFFFESLAEDQRERAIGVILSGTATDGTLGLEAIKAEGGITFAQDDSARYDSMPRSAGAAGCVDFVLSPENIAKELARIAKHPYVAGQPTEPLTSSEDDRASATAHEHDETLLPSGGRGTPRTGARQARAEGETARGKSGDNGFKKILLLLRNHSNVDFSLYKSTTIQRRITRRLVLNKQYTLENYADFLRGNAKELDALYSDLLISVTSFFRNPEGFDVLKRKVFPKLLQQRGDEPFRVWVLGCSTGQEAYSIAMVFVEAAEKAPRMRKLQVFATDLNDALLDKARHGLYAKSLAQDVSAERLRRFFVEEEGGYRVTKPLREMVVFARQNLISDPPFSRLDLISCRNLLIYLEPSLQKKVFPIFHYALKPEGFLLLGASESIGSFTDLFEPADKKHKIYSKKAAPTRAFQLPVKKARGEIGRGVLTAPRSAGSGQPALPSGQSAEGFRAELNAQREADRLIVNQFAPPGVLINAELQVLQFRGPTGAFLEPPTGKASFEVLKMAREGLMLPLRAAINKAKKENKTARKENVRVRQNGNTRTVNVEVIPLNNLRERCYLILFEDAIPSSGGRASPRASLRISARESVTARGDARPPGKKEESRRISELETELSETRDYLQSIQEQHEAANEELQASNEEVQSANEELQSINEELETSKEELESANEELTTVNEEMAHRNTELNRLNSDLGNLQTSTKLTIVLLGRDLTIRRFSAQAEKQFNLLPTDLGRPISNVRHNLDLPDLEQSLKEVIDTVREQEREVRDKEGRWFSLRVRPYMTLDNKVDGAVLVLVDINDLKRNEQATAAARDYAEAIIRTARDPLVILNADLRVHTANEAFYSTFKLHPAEVQGRLIYALGNHQWDIPRLRQFLEDILPRNSFFNHFEVTHDFESIGRRTMLLNARALRDHGEGASILVGIQDVTELLQFQAEVRRSEIRYRRLFEAAHDGVLIIDPATRQIVDANPFMTELLGYSHAELLGKELFEIGLVTHEEASRAAFRELLEKGFIDYEDLPLQTKTGEHREVEMVSNLHDEAGERVIQCNIRDITARKQVEQALRESEQRLGHLILTLPMALYTTDLEGRITLFNESAAELWGRRPEIGKDMWCGSWRMYRPDGAPLPLDQSPMAVALREGRAVRGEEIIVEREDGTRAYVLPHPEPLRDASGRIIGAINMLVDITARKQGEEARARLAAIVESSDDAIVSKDLNGVITSWNAGAERLFGYTAQEMVGQPVTVLIPPERFDEEAPILERIRQGKWIENLETERRRKDGTLLDVSLTVSPIIDSQGLVRGASKIARDITERRQAEEAQRESEERFRSIFTQALAGIAQTDLTGRFVQVNQRYCDIVGRSAEELYRLRLHDIIHPDDQPRNLKLFRPMIEGNGQPFVIEKRYLRPDESVVWVKNSVSLVRDRDGQPRNVVAVSLDITDRKQAEESLREADRRKNEFLAMLAHELRNPLAPIRNALAILELTKGNEEAIQSASAMMDRQIGQMVRLVDDLLDVSRISRGKIELRTGFIDLASSVNHAVEAARPVCESKGLNLTVTLPPQPVYLNADLIRLAQVVGNLLNNACKFTDKGGRIWLTAEVVASGEKSDEWRVTSDEKEESGDGSTKLSATQGSEDPGNEGLKLVTRPSSLVTIRVRDTGIGIAADQLLRIFDMFTQVDTSLERTRSGLGIGLTLAKNLVELHGGTLEVHSAGLGQGSEFVVRLPVIASDEWQAASGEKEEAGGDALAAHPPPLATKKRILVVDDNLDSAKALTMLLELTGNETHAAYDGLEAVEAAAAFRPDVILLDIALPELNGYDVARKIREQSWGQSIVLVALTGWGQEEDRRRSQEAGFNDHLTKPVDPATLTKLLASAAQSAS
jgi:two-component system CheB/CheR fusion protein